MILSEFWTHFIKGLDAVADAFDSTVYSDVVSLSEHGHATFLLHKGVGATGTSTITVEACDDIVPTNVTAVPFKYRTCLSGDTWSDVLDATVAGFATTAGSSQLYAIETDASDIASTGYGYVRLKAVEVVNSPVLGGILIGLSDPRQQQTIQASAID